MREELYRKLKTRLESLCINGAGEYYERPDDADMDDELYPRAIKHIDLWNHNVEFLDQEVPWNRPAVFIEFVPWTGAETDAGQFRLLDKIHELVAGLSGDTFMEFDIDSSSTNHNHEDIVENIETYTCVAFRQLK